MTELHRFFCVLALSLMVSPPLPAVAASLPQVASDAKFTFRTVRPPPAGASKRIAFPQSEAGTPPKSVRNHWFWSQVDPARSAGDAARLARVLTTLGPELLRRGAARGAGQTADRVLRDHGPALFLASKQQNLSPTLLLAVISVESAGRVDAASPKGAQGLMQLMPATARRFGVLDAFDPAQNIAGGARYLSFLLDMFDQDAVLALAAYNAGEGAVTRHGGVPPYAETRAYVARTLAGFELLRARCARPPESARAPCDMQAEG